MTGNVNAHQVADNDLGSGLHSQVEGGEFGCILNSGIYISFDANEEQDTFDVGVLHGHVEKVSPFIVHLEKIK